MSERIKVAICDDEPRALAIISASVESVFKDLGTEISMETFLSPKELLGCLVKKPFDLIFLDISMPGMDGITLGKELENIGCKSDLIFVSSRTDRVFDTFSAHPFDFVRKNRFLEDIGDVITRYETYRKRKTDSAQFAYVKDQSGMVAIDVSHVKSVECIRNMQVLHFADSDNEHSLYSRMSILEEELKAHDFIRIHKGYLVSCRFIRRFDSKTVLLTTGEELPVGRNFQHAAMQAYMDYVSRTGGIYIR